MSVAEDILRVLPVGPPGLTGREVWLVSGRWAKSTIASVCSTMAINGEIERAVEVFRGGGQTINRYWKKSQ